MQLIELEKIKSEIHYTNKIMRETVSCGIGEHMDRLELDGGLQVRSGGQTSHVSWRIKLGPGFNLTVVVGRSVYNKMEMYFICELAGCIFVLL